MAKSRQGGAGAWIYRYRDGWRVFYRQQPGGVLAGSRVFPTKPAAETLADEIRAQITTTRRTVGSAIDDYKKEMEARELRAMTVWGAVNALRRLLGDVRDSPLAVLTPRRCENLYVALATSGKYQPSSHHMMLRWAKTWGTWLAHSRRRWLRENPFAAIEKIGERADHRSDALRVSEARTFREKALALASKGDDGALGALIALTCSLRPSEIVQIAARDVDDDGAVLWVAGATLKTRNTRRPLEVADVELRPLLARRTDGKAPADRLFPYKAPWVREAAARIAEAAGVPPVDARMLRRTFATLAARRGRSLDDLAFSMGHGADASARTAQRHYIAPGAREAGAAGRVLGVLDGGKGKRR